MLILSIVFEIRKSNRPNWRGGKKERKKERRITGNKKNIKVKNKKSHHYMMTFNEIPISTNFPIKQYRTGIQVNPFTGCRNTLIKTCPKALHFLVIMHFWWKSQVCSADFDCNHCSHCIAAQSLWYIQIDASSYSTEGSHPIQKNCSTTLQVHGKYIFFPDVH